MIAQHGSEACMRAAIRLTEPWLYRQSCVCIDNRVHVNKFRACLEDFNHCY